MSVPPLQNLKVIRDELVERNWALEAFLFKYKNQEYVVLVKMYSEKEEKEDKFAIVKLEFLKKNSKFSYNTYATIYKLNIPDMKVFREFFGIEYSNNLGDIIQQFTQHFSTYIPNYLVDDKEPVLKSIIVEHLNKTDSESSKGIYCISVKRNSVRRDGSPGQRSPENNQKAAILVPDLYERLKEDYTLSFCFTEDSNKKKTEDEIYFAWAKRNGRL